MLKKLPLTLVSTLLVLASYGQTIVSTSPENRNVVLEEFTGIHCVYCPQGHAIAQGIQDSHPGDVFLINIHTGGYASPGNNEPDFRTPYGSPIAAQTGLAGYPAATVNRQNFPGMEQGSSGTTALNRNNWASASNQILADGSYVNLAVTADVDAATNVMNIHVEAYYTGDSPESTNFLNVAILQNNTLGPQTGGNVGNNYNHMHRLIDMVTGQWGEDITQTTTGTFVEKDYSYSIIPHNNYIPVELNDLEVVVFMSETHQKIISGNGALPTYTVVNNNDANVRYAEEFDTNCEGTEMTYTPRVNIQSASLNPITSLDINYSLNGTTSTYSWTGNIASLESETLVLPAITATIQETNTFDVSVANNDDNNANNDQSLSFDKALSGTGTIHMQLMIDQYGSEVRWNLKDSEGTVLYSGGPYPDSQPQIINETFYIPADCYSFSILDSYGDGGRSVTLTDSDGVQLFYTSGDYGSGKTGNFESNGVLSVNQSALENISLYPNPTSSILYLKNAENSNIQVYDVLGKLIMSQNNISSNEKEINVSSLQNGTYFMKISKDNAVTTKRFIVGN